MGLGNGNPNQGNKGSNWRFEYNLLLGIQEIANNTGGGGGGLLATSANQVVEQGILNSILSAVHAGQAYTQALVTDNGGVGCPTNCPVYLEIRIWDSGTQTFGPPIYYDATGNVVVPVGPVTFVNDAFSLSSILTQVTSINTKTPALGQATMANSSPVVLASDQSAIPVTISATPVVRTGTLATVTNAGTVAAGARSVSVYNAGAANGLWLGVSILPGVQVSYDAGGQSDTLGAFSYDGTGTSLVISTVV